MAIRPATADDLPAIGDILNAAILEGTASWRCSAYTADELAGWFATKQAAGTVRLMFTGGAVAGVSAAGAFRAGEGYALTREHSVYVASALRGRGFGTALLSDIVDWARAAGYHRLVGGVSADQPASLALHRRLGFTEAGRLEQVGRKNGRWLDLVLMMRVLD